MGGSAPPTVRTDPVADAERAAAEAAVAANSTAVLRKRSRKQSALLTSEPPAVLSTYGKTTLGG